MNITDMFKRKSTLKATQNWENPIKAREFIELMANLLRSTGYNILPDDGIRQFLKHPNRAVYEFSKFLSYGGVQPIICMSPFPLWKIVTIGYRSDIEWKRDIIKYQCRERSMLAHEIIQTIKPATDPEEINLILVSSIDLGFDLNERLPYGNFCDRALNLGYELCPPEIAFEVADIVERDEELRKKHIRIGMKPVWMKKDEWDFEKRPWILTINPGGMKKDQSGIYAVNTDLKDDLDRGTDFSGALVVFRVPKVPLKKVRISN